MAFATPERTEKFTLSPEKFDRPKSAGASPACDHNSFNRNRHVVRFGVPLGETLYNGKLPMQLVDLLVYVAHEGVTTTDIFRRQGSMTDTRQIIADLAAGRIINLTAYTFYTLATVIKIFLLKLPDGLLGAEVERLLLSVLDLPGRGHQYKAIRLAVNRLPVTNQQLLILLLGLWFRIVSHSEYNAMSSEAVAASVVACLFHTAAAATADAAAAVTDISVGRLNQQLQQQLQQQLLQLMIDDFSVVEMLGKSNVRYFTEITSSAPIRKRSSKRKDTSTNEFAQEHLTASVEIRLHNSTQGDSSVQGISNMMLGNSTCDGIFNDYAPFSNNAQLNSASSFSAPEVRQEQLYQQQQLRLRTAAESVQHRQLLRMKKRSSWFLAPPTDIMTRSCMTSDLFTRSSCRLPASQLSSRSFELQCNNSMKCNNASARVQSCTASEATATTANGVGTETSAAVVEAGSLSVT